MKAKTIIRILILNGLGGILVICSHTVAVAQVATINDASTSNTEVEQQHEFHDNFSERFAHKGYIILQERYNLPKKSRDQLRDVVKAYLEMKEALVKDDLEAADDWAREMDRRTANVNVNRLKGKELKALKQHSELLKENLEHFQHMKSLYEKRTYFSHISEITYCMVKSFSLEFQELYALFCPSAFSGNGAYWLSTTKGSRCPYLDTGEESCRRVTFEFLGEKKKAYISPFGRSKKSQ